MASTKHQHRPDHPVLHQREPQHALVAEHFMQFLVADPRERRIHHQDQARCDGDRRGAHAEAIQKRNHSGRKPAQRHAEQHGGENPGGEITIEKRKPALLHPSGLRAVAPLRAANLIDLVLDGELFQRAQRQGEEQADSAIEDHKGVAKRARHFLFRSLHRCRVGNAPVRRHRLPRPVRALLLRRVVAHREDEIQLRRIRAAENSSHDLLRRPVVGNRADSICRSASGLGLPGGMAARAVRRELALALVVENRLGHDGPRRVAGAEKEDVVMIGHRLTLRSRPRSTAAFRSTARRRRLRCPNESAHELPLHLGRDRSPHPRPRRSGTAARLRCCRSGSARSRRFRSRPPSGAPDNRSPPARRQRSPPTATCFSRTAAGTSPRTTTSDTASRPPGFSTRNASRSTRSLSALRLITQFEMIDVDRLVRQRDVLDLALQELDVLGPRLPLVLARQRQHLVRHVEAVSLAVPGPRAAPTATRRCRRPSPGRGPPHPA